MDLEDSVTPDDKSAARRNVVRALREIDFGPRLRMVRVNALDTPFAYRDLIDVVEEAGDRLDVVMVPKVGSPRDVSFVDMLLSQIESNRRLPAAIAIEAQIETGVRVPQRPRDRLRIRPARSAGLRIGRLCGVDADAVNGNWGTRRRR